MEDLPRSLAIGDFNSDNKIVLIVRKNGESGITVFLGYGNGSFHKEMSFLDSDFSDLMAVIDFNNDNHLDIIIIHEYETVNILLGYGNGTFATKKDFPVNGRTR